MSVSLLSLVGRVGNDPESRYTNGGNLVVTFSVATSTLARILQQSPSTIKKSKQPSIWIRFL